ncbi:hypothetical protein [Methylobacterium gnaphalii]|uniref:Uncharacterized protein n=1 Tax=Methylobacterium gnaphalii TaxID=1010610 RepID=A0A512JRU9_9HYPH|nr:hypothetical protein [Methylobacterium gnaphalii]GEP12671.1 hypothetical protein MGN01_45160 [Methylobacterium gnaphalii]GJD71379.1 hypothetical protein MMMDOFMJ_4335 [Methylobacterium gnaphalii]GLS51393.1 hypothetical protein GCM10007885_42500 [Methylobacterium gnaphalii]
MAEKSLASWVQRLAGVRKTLGREPTLAELLRLCSMHKMSEAEVQTQAKSWARANISTDGPRFD